jgi:mono/diheme cytochrome c family protein
MRQTFIALAMLLAMQSSSMAQEVGDAGRGATLALSVCAQCHAVRARQLRSPDPMAPNFSSIATTLGMTDRALRVWLQSSHPTMPNYVLSPSESNNVIAYILSLKSDRYPI